MDALAREYEIQVKRQTDENWLLLNTSLQVLQTIWTSEGLPKTQAVLQDVIIQDSPLGFGAIRCTSTITLNDNLPESIDIRRNWVRWARGNEVSVKVLGSGSTLYPVKTLYILRAKYSDGRKPLGVHPIDPPSLTLELGDLLELRDTRDIATDDGGVTWNGSIDLIDYVNQWLTYFELPPLTFLPNETRPTKFIVGPIPYSGGSISEFLGNTIYGYTQQRLYVDHLNRLRLTSRLDLTTPTYLDLRSDEWVVDLRSPTEAEMPAGIVRITASPEYARRRDETTDNQLSITETKNFIHRETIRTELFRPSGYITTTRRGTSTPKQVIVNGQFTKPKSYEEVTVKSYDVNYLALEKVTTTRKESPPLKPGEINSGMVQTLFSERFLNYVNLVVESIKENIEKIEARAAYEKEHLIRSITSTAGMSFIGRFTQWKKIFGDLYATYIHESRPLEEEDSEAPITIQQEGVSNPPSTDFFPSLYTTKTYQVVGTADFGSTPGIDARHQREFNLGRYCPDVESTNAIAKETGIILIGRYHGQNLAYPITDAWLQNPPPPHFPVFVMGDDGIQDAYNLNAHALYLGDKECYGGGAGIWLGEVDRATNTITPSYRTRILGIGTETGELLGGLLIG
jgi:hypothetical protein